MRGRSPFLALLTFLFGTAVSLLTPAFARAHRLVAEFAVLPGHKIQVSCRYKVIPRSIPAVGARVRVFRPNDALLARGETDEQGEFVFAFDRSEPLRVEAYQEGHRAEVQIDARELNVPSRGGQEKEIGTANKSSQPKQEHSLAKEEDVREWIKEILVGVGFLLALGAFLLSLRNAKHVRELQRKLLAPDSDQKKPITDQKEEEQ